MKRALFIVVIILINIFIDQFTKVIVRANIQLYETIQVIGDYFILTNVENTGAFLGMGSNLSPFMRWTFLLILPVIVLTYVIYYIIKNKDLNTVSLIAFCCIVGGGIANIFDRFAYGKVTDFLYIHISDILKTGVFNVADMSVTFGLITLIFSNFFTKKPSSNHES